MTVIQFPGRRVLQPPVQGSQQTAGRVYALADLLVAAQVALHVFGDRNGFQILFGLIEDHRFLMGAAIPAHLLGQVARYLPDQPDSSGPRLELYRKIYVR